ncbi:MAG TPA: MXAN_5187 C-terminal domain-containing protein [Polyangiaceae bacterium]|nr:MXAN_5187 C-terminal domain-containing protein [Polyangiaceae bacterium]
MELDEVEAALDELEVRLERLRALYEQYFLGFEKLEPSVLRKDVDRRIYVLRKAHIRNTGRRFKLQTIIQRYNTFQQYWQRVCREIENGTYKRHVLRAERNIGPTDLLTAAARRRFGKQRQPNAETSADAAAAPDRASPGSDAPDTVQHRPSALPASTPSRVAGAPATARLDSSVPPPTLPRPAPPAPPSRIAASLTAPSSIPPATQPSTSYPEDLRGGLKAPTAPLSARANAPMPSARRSEPPKRANETRGFESLDLDMDFMGDWDPAATAPEQTPKAAPAPKGLPASGGVNRRLAPPPKPGKDGETATPQKPKPLEAPKLEAPKLVAQKVEVQRAQPPQVELAKAVRPQTVEPQPEPARKSPRAPVPQEAPPPAAAAAPRVSPPAASPSPIAPSPPTPTSPEPSPSDKLERAKPAAAAASREAARKARAAPEPLTDDRLRDLHSRLVQASQNLNRKPTSYESLAKSLKETEAKLRAQHGNRRIDFEIVIKDGKPAVKPTVR